MLRTALCLFSGLLVALAAAAPASAAGCEGDGDCKAGRVCLAGKCAAKPKSCSKDSECPGDLVCEQTRCVLPPGEAGPAPASTPPAAQMKPQAQPRSTSPQTLDLELPPLVAGPGALTTPPAASGQGLRPVYDRDSWPLSLIDRPLVLGKGMAEGTALFDKSLTTNHYDGLALGLRAYYGVDEKLTAGVSNVSFCLFDCTGKSFFQSISFDAHYLYYADAGVNVVPELSLDFGSLSPFTASLSPAVEIAYRLGPKMTLWLQPRLSIGVVNRGDMGSPDWLSVAVQPRYALTDQLTLVPSLALRVPFNATDFWTMPVGAGLHYAVSKQLDLGGDLTFSTLLPHSGLGFFAERSLQLYAVARL